jgi:hypothetical protein
VSADCLVIPDSVASPVFSRGIVVKEKADMRMRIFALVLGAVATVVAGAAAAGVSPREHESTLEVQLMGLPRIVMPGDTQKTVAVTSTGAIQIPEKMYQFKGTLKADLKKMPFTVGNNQGTRLDTRLVQSVQISVWNQAGTVEPSGYQPREFFNEFGGAMPLGGHFIFKFRPFKKRKSGRYITETPKDLTIAASPYGETRALTGGGVTPKNTAVTAYVLGKEWRTGTAITVEGAAAIENLFSVDKNSAYDNYQRCCIAGWIQRGSPMFWNNSDLQDEGNVKLVTPVHIHMVEERDDLHRPRIYSLASYASLSMRVLPAGGSPSLSFAPKPSRGLPSFAAAMGMLCVGIVKVRRTS